MRVRRGPEAAAFYDGCEKPLLAAKETTPALVISTIRPAFVIPVLQRGVLSIDRIGGRLKVEIGQHVTSASTWARRESRRATRGHRHIKASGIEGGDGPTIGSNSVDLGMLMDD